MRRQNASLECATPDCFGAVHPRESADAGGRTLRNLASCEQVVEPGDVGPKKKFREKSRFSRRACIAFSARAEVLKD